MVLFNVLGELVMPSGQSAPTAALLEPLGAMGIGRHAARQAIQRSGQDGWTVAERDGRVARWSLTAAGRDLLMEGIARVEALSQEVDDWDGTWQVLLISIPQERRTVRQRLYRALQWDGFGSPAPGVWVSPRDHPGDRIGNAIAANDLVESTLAFRARPSHLGLTEAEMVSRAWPLKSLEEHYAALVQRFEVVDPQTPEEALRALLALDDELQPMPLLDPHLPVCLVPGWQGRQRAATLLSLRRAWLGPAREYWAELLKR